MEVEIFTLADFAADYGQGKLNIIGTFDAIFPQQFPFVHPNCSLALRLRVANSESGMHNLNIKFIDPDGKDFNQPVNGDLQVAKNPNADYSTSNFILNFSNLKFDKPGKYAFELHWDGEFRSGLTLNLVKSTPNVNSPKVN
jgi:hypothetical protein